VVRDGRITHDQLVARRRDAAQELEVMAPAEDQFETEQQTAGEQ
jgi:hypothetical protein